MPKELTHAGAVVFRAGGDGVSFLIVSSSDGKHWVLPKGHIESDEAVEDTVHRELREETGVVGEVIKPLTVQEFDAPRETVRVLYFLVRESTSGPADESRRLRWLSGAEAVEALSFEDARNAVRMAIEEVI